jgi:membrane-associated phospholipid phosphatase
VKHHFQSNGFFGWQIIVGLLLFAGMTLTLAAISKDVRNGKPLTVADVQLSDWLHTHGSPSATTAMKLITSLGSTAVVSCLAGLFGVYLLWRRQLHWLTAMLLSVFGGMGLNRLLKFAFQRPRPNFSDPILSLTGYSFPSGHTMVATVLYGVLAAFLISRISRWPMRVLVGVLAACLIALVGFSRIYLGAHYLSDVMAAIVEGLAWLSLCLTAVFSERRYRSLRRT